MHRSALVQISANAQSAGAHSADLAQVPAIAIRAVEVLRDGASAQYGSDAIAGVINMTLRDDTDGFSGYARYGQYYRGDGEDYQLALNGGFKLGDAGFINISGEYVNASTTSRSFSGASTPISPLTYVSAINYLKFLVNGSKSPGQSTAQRANAFEFHEF